MENPMLGKQEFDKAAELYSEGIKNSKAESKERFPETLDYYYDLTGFKETEPNVIIHHSIDLLGHDWKD